MKKKITATLPKPIKQISTTQPNLRNLRGKIQSPLGSLARISTRPYWKRKVPFVLSLAETTGGRMVARAALRRHSFSLFVGETQLDEEE